MQKSVNDSADSNLRTLRSCEPLVIMAVIQLVLVVSFAAVRFKDLEGPNHFFTSLGSGHAWRVL